MSWAKITQPLKKGDKQAGPREYGPNLYYNRRSKSWAAQFTFVLTVGTF